MYPLNELPVRINTLIKTAFCCLLFCGALQAQSNWQPGHVIVNGQKITGEVDDRDWPYHIGSIDFRTKKGAAVTTYRPEDEVTVEVAGRRFVGATINYITNPRDLELITADTVRNRATESGFLRQYYAGEMKLYQYVDRIDKRHFYLQKEGESPVYLEYEWRLRERADKKILKTINNYRYQLSQLMGEDCPDLAISISETEYSLKDLSSLVKGWYKCQSLRPDFTASVNDGKFSVGGVAALYQTSLRTSTPAGFTTESDPNLGPAFGLSAKYTLPGGRKRFAVKADVFYHDAGTVSFSNIEQGNVVRTTLKRTQSRSTLRFGALAEYRVLTGNVPLYVAGGLEVGLLLTSDVTFDQIFLDIDGRETTITTDLNQDEFQTNEIGPVGEIGTYIGNFQLALRASRTTQVNVGESLQNYRVGLLAAYWF